MSRRVRVANCPHCGKVTAIDRKRPQPKHEDPAPALTICGSCFAVFENAKVESRLMPTTCEISSRG